MKFLAAAPIPIGTFEGLGPLGQENCVALSNCFDQFSASMKFEIALSAAVGVMTVIAGIWFIFSVLSATIQWLSAGSDKQTIQNATKKLGTSLVGLFLTVAAYGLITLVGKVLGFTILEPAILIVTFLHP